MKNTSRILQSVQLWIRTNKLEAIILFAILILAAFLRLWRIDEYLPFLGDEGRDVRVVRRFLTDFDLMFIGPRTSIGDMYLGPLYYYLMAPFLLLWNFSPLGPAVMVALLGIATVWLVWYTAREWFGKIAAIVASSLYAMSPVVVQHSTHSWNPNIMPFFSLLAIYAISRAWLFKEFKWLLVLGMSLGFVVQSHYLGLLLFPVIGVFWLLSFMSLHKTPNFRPFILYSLFFILLFSILMSPLFLFDAKHGWHNFKSVLTFFTDRQETVSVKPWNALPDIWPLWYEQVVARLVLAKDTMGWAKYLAFALIAAGILVSQRFFKSQKIALHALSLLGLWIVTGLVGLGLYKQHIYDHYFGFMFTAPFLLLGAISQGLWTKAKFVVIVLVIVLGWLNFKNTHLLNSSQQQMSRTREISQSIIKESNGQAFNFGLIAKRNYEEGYLYFFELEQAQVKEIDPQNIKGTLTEQLFVVCEDETCNPINNPKAEIANFGWVKLDREWEVRGIKIFRLIHTPPEKND